MTLSTTPRRFALIAVPAFAVTVCVFVLLDLQVIFEPPWLLPILNTVFLSAALFAVAYLAGRGYRASGAAHLLLFGNAVLVYGAGSLIAGWVIGAHGSVDSAVTLHNAAAAIGGTLHLASGLLVKSEGRFLASASSRRRALLATYLGVVLSLSLLTAASLHSLTPPFFVPGVGFTPLRHVTLGTAVTGFSAAALLAAERYRVTRSDFLYWSASALGLFAVGLGALFFQRVVGSPVGWIGRSAQYLGSLFLLVAALHAVREVRRRRLPLDRAVAALFHEARENYQALVEAVADPIVAFDQDGSVLLWNTAAERTFGYTQDEALGTPLVDLIGLLGESVDGVTGRRFARDDRAALAMGTRLEMKAQHKDGMTLPVEVALSWRQGRGGLVGTMILRDVTDRQQATDRLARLNRHLRTISLCNQALVRARDEGELLRETCRIIVEDGGHRAAWVGFLEETGECVRPVVAVGCDPVRLDRHAMSLTDTALGTCPVTQALLTGIPQIVRDIPGSLPQCPWRDEAVRLGIGSSVSLPLKGEERTFGVVTIYSARPGGLDDEETKLLVELADDIAYGLHAIRTRAAHERALAEIQSLAEFPGENPNPILRVRGDGTILYANAASTPLLQMWDVKTGDRVPAEWFARIEGALKADTQESIDVSCGERVYSVVLAPITDGRYVNLYGRDVTARRQVEAALRASEAVLRTVLDSLPVGVAVNSVDPVVRFEYMNDNFLKFYRTTREALASPDAFWDAVYEDPEVREHIKKRVMEDCASGDPARMHWDDVPISRSGDGITYYISARNIPIPSKHLMVSIVWDVTPQKRLEAERLHLEAQLRQQQKLEALGTLASGVAHEINNPIAGIMNYAQLIADTAPADHPAAGHAQEIVQETERVATIVRNLLQFARQEKQTHSPARLQDIVEQTLSLVRAALRRDQIALTVKAPDGLPTIKCRSQQIQQVLLNLLTNARDALNAKYPGHHTDKTIHVTVRPVEHAARRWLRLTVADQGTGIPPEVHDRIFDPFFTTKPRDQGTGLGLAISHGIVTDHGGRLTFETTPGEGTQFHVDLPVGENE